MSKAYDIIVWGATGFTGQLVAEYLLKQYGVGKTLAWAMAGRNQDKLEKVRQTLGNESIPLLVADSHDKASLEALVKTNPGCLYHSRPLCQAWRLAAGGLCNTHSSLL